MEYKIQPGDTITRVTRQLGTDWKTLKSANPTAVARSAKTGDWIVKAGKTVSVPLVFQEVLTQQTAKQPARASSGQTPSASSPKMDDKQPSTASRGETTHVLQKGETIWGLARKKYRVDPAETVRLNKISNANNLQIGREIRIPTGEATSAAPAAPASENIVASWYGKPYHGRTMANGARFDMNAATIAHRNIPFGTAVELENPETGEKVQAVVTDRGPFIRGRDVDLSYGLAKRLSLVRQGVGNLKMRVL
jgi:rare lipoprotein A